MVTHNEKVDMLLIYGEARKNVKLAERVYRERYPERYVPNYKIFTRLEATLRQNDTAFSARKGKPIRKRARLDEAIGQVLQYFQNNPRNSINNAKRALNISFSSIQRILKENKFHDYKIHNLEHLSQPYLERRMIFLAEIIVAAEEDPHIYNHILWTDESRFVSNGIPNKKNTHYWATENPHMVNPVANQGHYGVNVWCGIIGRHLIGPYFYEGSLTGARYLNFLREELPILLQNVQLRHNNIWLQQDGAPAHNARISQNFLNETYEGKWIGTHGPIRWPPKSPDLTPLDFFLWGTLKNEVYKTQTRDMDDLKEKIRIACDHIDGNMLHKITNREVRKRFEKCATEGGGHIENLL